MVIKDNNSRGCGSEIKKSIKSGKKTNVQKNQYHGTKIHFLQNGSGMSLHIANICTYRLSEKLFMGDCFQENVNESKSVEDFKVCVWTSSAYYDMDGVGNGQYGWGLSNIFGMENVD